MSYASRQFAQNWINHYSRKDTNHHIKGSDTAANRRTLVIVPFSAVIDDRIGAGRLDTFTTLTDTELDLNTAANWDTIAPTDYTVAATRAGKDFYLYACIPASGNVPVIKLSANSTWPVGYTSHNSRRIGGFHCSPGDCIDLAVNHNYFGFLQGDIVYHSIWDEIHRPESTPEGMVYVPGPDIWVDIYLCNVNSYYTLSSAFGATIKTGAGGLSGWWAQFVEYAAMHNKRLPNDQEFEIAASNSTIYVPAGGAPPTTCTFPLDANGRTSISDYFLVMATSAYNQWLNAPIYTNDDGEFASNTTSDGLSGNISASIGYGDKHATIMAAGGRYVNPGGSGNRYCMTGRYTPSASIGARFISSPRRRQ